MSAPAERAASRAPATYGRPAARAEPDDGVQRADCDGGDLGGACGIVVLGVLLRRGGARGTAGDEGDDEPGRDGERRLALDGVDEGEPAGGSGADVDEPAAAHEPVGDGVDRLDDRRRSRARPRRERTHPRRSSAPRGRSCRGDRGRPRRHSTPRSGARRTAHALVGRSSHAGQCMHDLVEWSRPVGRARPLPAASGGSARMTATR